MASTCCKKARECKCKKLISVNMELTIGLDNLIAGLVGSLSYSELIDFVLQLEERVGACDLTVPLYRELKKIVAKESPEDL